MANVRHRGYPPGFDGRSVTSKDNALKTGLHDAGNRAARRYLAAINRALSRLEVASALTQQDATAPSAIGTAVEGRQQGEAAQPPVSGRVA